VTHSRKLLLGGVSALLLGGAVVLAACGDSSAPPQSPEASAAAAVDPAFRYPDGSTELMWAVYEGDAGKAARLIAAGVDVNASNRYGSNAMQLAAETADVGMLTMLLDAGANADSPNPEGQTALMLVARTGSVEAARLLVERGATVDAREGWGDQTALMWASARRHPEMVEYLIERGADVNARSRWRDYQRHLTAESRAKNMDTGGLTPLLYAARENCVACVDVLIAHGVDVDLPDPDRVSPLMLSIFNNNWDIAKRLIEAGADVNQWDIYGQAPLHAIASRRDNMNRTSIDDLNETTGGEILDMMLARGADPNLQLFMRPADQRGAMSRGTTPLHVAAASADLEMVQALLAHGADVNLNDTDNETALMMASGGGGGQFGGGGVARGAAAQIVRLLCEAGADVDANALYHHLQRTRGGTALHYAVRAGSGVAIDELIACGADLDIKDPDGLTALDYAMARGYIPFLQMRQPPRLDLADKLRAAGAMIELPEEPYWPPVGPPIGYEATVWPLGVDHLSRTYEEMPVSQSVLDKVANLRYTGTPQPAAVGDQASLDGSDVRLP
jgi:ankyrin repeat protein